MCVLTQLYQNVHKLDCRLWLIVELRYLDEDLCYTHTHTHVDVVQLYLQYNHVHTS